jgi:hypothetical protein
MFDGETRPPEEIVGGPLDGAESLSGPVGVYREVRELGRNVRVVKMPSGTHEAYEYDTLSHAWRYAGRVPQSLIDLKTAIRELPTSGLYKPLVQKLIIDPASAPKMIAAPGDNDADAEEGGLQS